MQKIIFNNGFISLNGTGSLYLKNIELIFSKSDFICLLCVSLNFTLNLEVIIHYIKNFIHFNI